MIRNEIEYQASLEKLKAHESQLEACRSQFQEMELTEDQIKRGIDPILCFYLQIKDEVEEYKRLK